MTIVEAARGVTGGVDTHLDVHVAAALDPLGGLLGTERFDTDSAGYKALLAWLEAFGDVTKIGVEGTGSYGAGLARYLRRVGVEVIEVDRPNRAEAPAQRQVRSPRRRRGRPGRPQWSGERQPQVERRCRRGHPGPRRGQALGPPGPGQGARSRCATSATAHLNSSVAASKASRCPLSSPKERSFGPTRSPDPVTAATKASLSSLAHRISALDDELAELDERIEALLVATVPDLLDLFGVGPDTAAALVMAAGDNPERLHSEAAWAHLCGVSPIPTGSGKNSGKVKAHDGGDRQANSALWRIVMVRIAHDPERSDQQNSGLDRESEPSGNPKANGD